MNFVICRVCSDVLVRDDEKHGGICTACLAHQTAGVRPSLDEQIKELERVSADARENWNPEQKPRPSDMVALRCDECGGTGAIANDGPYSTCGDCGGTGISNKKRLRVQIDLMECTNCGKQALGFIDLRITNHKCSGGWRVVKSFMAEFSIQELLLNMEGL